MSTLPSGDTPSEPATPRDAVVAAALGELGKKDAAKYWSRTLTTPPPYPHDWCGGFVLWALKQAGLAADIFWEIGTGFLFRLPQTHDPKPGDVAYFDHNEHHALVAEVNGNSVELVNGNGNGGMVTTSLVNRSQVKAFYSIEPLLPEEVA